jgi:hypothetical protein
LTIPDRQVVIAAPRKTFNLVRTQLFPRSALLLSFTGISLICCHKVQAADAVTNWHTFRATTATTLSGQGTSSPVFGSTTETSATGFLVGYMDSPLSLVNVGDKITFSFQVSFNDAAGMPTGAGDQFRFGLYDISGTKATADNTAAAGVAGQTDNWVGYRYGVRSGSGTGSTGSIRERAAAGGDLNPMANAQTVSLGSPTGDQVLWHSGTNGVGGGTLYTGELTLQLSASGVDLSGFFRGNNTTNIFAASDTTSAFTTDFEAVAFLNGGSLSADQMLFQNVNVTYIPVIPEPSAATLVALGLIGFVLRSVRSRTRR